MERLSTSAHYQKNLNNQFNSQQQHTTAQCPMKGYKGSYNNLLCF
uniref:Uncharacterized protein n=1 Tax=Anguilla anguilla TaxID=7936 RepID=A0A0E9PGG0_ANGAN